MHLLAQRGASSGSSSSSTPQSSPASAASAAGTYGGEMRYPAGEDGAGSTRHVMIPDREGDAVEGEQGDRPDRLDRARSPARGKPPSRAAPPKANRLRAKNTAQYAAAAVPCVAGLPPPNSSMPPAASRAAPANTTVSTARPRGSGTGRNRSFHPPAGLVSARFACRSAARAAPRPAGLATWLLRAGRADLPDDVVELVELRIEQRLAAGHERRRDLPLRIGPGHDVGEPEVAEGVLRVGSVEAQPLAAQHEAHAVAQRQAEGEVELEVGLLADGAPKRARLEDAHAVELAAVEQQLVEAAQPRSRWR